MRGIPKRKEQLFCQVDQSLGAVDRYYSVGIVGAEVISSRRVRTPPHSCDAWMFGQVDSRYMEDEMSSATDHGLVVRPRRFSY